MGVAYLLVIYRPTDHFVFYIKITAEQQMPSLLVNSRQHFLVHTRIRMVKCNILKTTDQQNDVFLYYFVVLYFSSYKFHNFI